MFGLKINWKSVGSALVTTLGLVAQGGAAGAYGQKAGPALTLLGILLQAFSHPVASSSAATPTPPQA